LPPLQLADDDLAAEHSLPSSAGDAGFQAHVQPIHWGLQRHSLSHLRIADRMLLAKRS
jgi:hypothetical protein